MAASVARVPQRKAGVVVVARVLFLIWMDPPYGDHKTVLCENMVDYSIMAIGILQIYNLL